MAVALLTDIEYAPVDENGDTIPDGYVYFYEPGTMTLKSAWKEAAITNEHTNPARLDGNGKIKAFLNGEYRIKVYKADDSTLVRDTDNLNKAATVISGNFNLADNGSFETDSTGDGTPDNVVLTAYTSGTVARDAADGTDGAASLKFSDGGNGGGYAVGENFFGVSVNRDLEVLFELKSSAANVRNLMELIWYDKDQTELSTSTVYDDAAANPTDWEPRGKRLTPPASATYAKWRFYGCHSSAASNGKITRLDNVIVRLGIGQTWDKGSDVASATQLPAVHDGGFADVTGTVTITSIESQGVGTLIKRKFTDVLVLTHHATDLQLPTGANITTAAGDVAEFYEYAAGDWICTNYLPADGKQVAAIASGDIVVAALPSGSIVQRVTSQDSAVATGTTATVSDDTIPQITEGDQYMSLAITPTNTNNILRITHIGNYAHTAGTGLILIAALFQDTTANALAAVSSVTTLANVLEQMTVTYEMVAGTTSATTFKIRAGGTTGATMTFNGTAGARKFGGVCASILYIEEIAV